jgi:hypothetical protein
MQRPRLLALLLALTASPALADEVPHPHYGQLICDGNRALIRFTRTVNDEPPIFSPDPSAIPFAATPANADTCTLADGREVRIKTGGHRPMPFGECGAAASTFVSLWVGQRKVLSRHSVKYDCYAYDDNEDIIVLHGDILTLCASADRKGELPAPSCRDASDILRAAVYDPVEYPADPGAKPKVGTITISFSDNDSLCSSFLRPYSPFDAINEANLLWPRHDPTMLQPTAPETDSSLPTGMRLMFPFGAAEEIAFEQVARYPDDPKSEMRLNPTYAWFDFDNDWKEDLVFRTDTFSGSGVYSHFHVYSDSAALGVQAKLDAFAFDERQVWPSLRTLAALNLPPATVYRGDLPETDFVDNFTLQSAFRYDDKTYVFAAPFSRETNPKAIIYRPLPGGKAEPVCIYDTVQENY